MTLRLLGAGLPRTGTESLSVALERLLDAPCHHMRVVPGHPYDFGSLWRAALETGSSDWPSIYAGYAAGVGWPTSLFWRELSGWSSDAVVLLSGRATTGTWLDSMEATVLPVARACAPQDWTGGRDLAVMMERFAGTPDWDDRGLLGERYEEWMSDVRAAAPPGRLVEWQPDDGWEPLCVALGVPVPDVDFPWQNRRGDWVY